VISSCPPYPFSADSEQRCNSNVFVSFIFFSILQSVTAIFPAFFSLLSIPCLKNGKMVEFFHFIVAVFNQLIVPSFHDSSQVAPYYLLFCAVL
jgi:hypothetical protein